MRVVSFFQPVTEAIGSQPWGPPSLVPAEQQATIERTRRLLASIHLISTLIQPSEHPYITRYMHIGAPRIHEAMHPHHTL